MEQTDFDILTSPESRELIERHIDDDPARIALKLRNPAVTRQIRVLQKCRIKLPSYYAARCIVPQVAYEQASSEATAAARTEGIAASLPATERRLAVDLTCGLGVDSLALSKVFDRVVTVEIDPLRAEIARWNFDLLGAGNIEVVRCMAEDFLAGWTEECPIDLVYVDPSRKTADGRRVYSLEESSPNMPELLPALRRMVRRIVVKLSPLFDVAEIYRLFGEDACVEVISLDGECKEALARIGFKTEANGGESYLRITVIHRGEVRRYDFSRAETGDTATSAATSTATAAKPDAAVGDARFLQVADVAFHKARAVRAYAQKYLSGAPGGLRLSGDYIFTDEPLEDFPGRSYRITFRHPYQPKEIGRLLRSRGTRRVNIHRRGFPYPADEIARAMGVALGGDTDIFCTLADGEPTVFFVHRMN